MSSRRFALIDPAAGVSGDMLLGALIDVGLSPAWLRGLPGRLGLGDVTVDVADVMRCGMRSTKVTVRVGGASEGPFDVSDHPHDHHHPPAPGDSPTPHHHEGGNHPHRHVGELLGMIAAADLAPAVKSKATATFQLLAEAEGRIHGVPAAAVALHEVGAFDALIDIVGTVEGFDRLGVSDVYTRPVALGEGWVRAAHGLLPVPAPATALLLEGLPIAPNGPIQGEATTPTGAALLRALVTGPEPETGWRMTKVGWGAGGRNPSTYPNMLRLVLGESAPDDRLVVVATDLDDMSPEYLEPLREALSAAGAVDVQSWATQMKKSRIGFRIEALTPTARVDQVTAAFFLHSTTAGVRRWAVARKALERDHWVMTRPDGEAIRIKTVHGPAGPRVKPEFDDVMAVARRTGQPPHQLSRTIQEEAQRAVGTQTVGEPAIVNPKESLR
jgi:uncharacterized protein (TIGR00299 family) protein